MSVLSKFTVIDLVKTRSASVATITGNCLKFNKDTATELSNPRHVQVLINPKAKQFAIRACKEEAPNAVPFLNSGKAKQYVIKISAAAVVDMIRKMTDWKAEDIWNVPGIYFTEEEALVYDLNTATAPAAKPASKTATGKVGRPRKATTEEVDS